LRSQQRGAARGAALQCSATMVTQSVTAVAARGAPVRRAVRSHWFTPSTGGQPPALKPLVFKHEMNFTHNSARRR